MKKFHFLFALTVLVLSACTAPSPEPIEETPPVEEPTETDLPADFETDVDFLSQAEALDVASIIETHKDYYVANAPKSWTDYETAETYPKHMKDYLFMWTVGTFKQGDYEGQNLVDVVQQCEGPCSGQVFRYAVNAQDEWTLLAQHSSTAWKDGGEMLAGPHSSIDETTVISVLETPETLELYANDTVLLTDAFSRVDENHFPNSDQLNTNTPGFFTEITENIHSSAFPRFYQGNNGCLYAVTPDGIMARYMVFPKQFTAQKMEGAQFYETPQATLSIDTAEGENIEMDYSLAVGGCGLMWSCLDTVTPTAEEEANMEAVGTVEGRSIYLPKTFEVVDPETEPGIQTRFYQAFNNYLMTKLYQEDGTPASEYESAENLTEEEFAKDFNAFFFKLDNGQYMLAYNSSYAPTVECGKPVIYLYPEENTVVNVQVAPQKITKVIPEYSKLGWTVLARPNGQLTDLSDGQNYPYLFWEGTSSKTLPIGETWTLAKADVPTQLPVALQKMGLNSQETADFMEFWGPRLSTLPTPYVEFGFVNEKVMDQVAPLTIRPFPDSVYRVFMNYRGADKVGAPMPNYKPFVRHGFTVVEWGGSLYGGDLQ